MVQCDECSLWVHADCCKASMGLKRIPKSDLHFVCPGCLGVCVPVDDAVCPGGAQCPGAECTQAFHKCSRCFTTRTPTALFELKDGAFKPFCRHCQAIIANTNAKGAAAKATRDAQLLSAAPGAPTLSAKDLAEQVRTF